MGLAVQSFVLFVYKKYLNCVTSLWLHAYAQYMDLIDNLSSRVDIKARPSNWIQILQSSLYIYQ
jgi:hypothetical protein